MPATRLPSLKPRQRFRTWPLRAPGAIVRFGGHHFVIAVSTGKFLCDGSEVMGISTQAPIYAEIEGKRSGDSFTFNGRELVIEDVN